MSIDTPGGAAGTDRRAALRQSRRALIATRDAPADFRLAMRRRMPVAVFDMRYRIDSAIVPRMIVRYRKRCVPRRRRSSMRNRLAGAANRLRRFPCVPFEPASQPFEPASQIHHCGTINRIAEGLSGCRCEAEFLGCLRRFRKTAAVHCARSSWIVVALF